MDTIDPYAALPDFYDLEHAEWGDDVPLYVNFAVAVGDPILELGCGSGRLLVPLAEEGFRVVGTDRSRPMLERARRAVDEAGVGDRVRVLPGEMTEADDVPGGPFGLVIIALNGLLHLPTLEEQRQALLAARRALDPRGQLVVDVLNPAPELLRSFDGNVVHEGSWTLDNGDRLDKFGARRLSPASQRIETDLWYDVTQPDGTLRRVAASFPMRYLHASELRLLLEACGFVDLQLYGNYDLDPYDDAADRIVVTAEVTPAG